MAFDKAAAENALAALLPERSNGELAAHWFGQWRGWALPPRAAFSPRRLRSFLPDLMLLNVVPEESVTVRLAGTRMMHILGLGGGESDFLELARPELRAARLARFSRVARGALYKGHRVLAAADGDDVLGEEILLPFAPDGDGTTLVLAHVHLPLERYRLLEPGTASAEPVDGETIVLREIGDAAALAASA